MKKTFLVALFLFALFSSYSQNNTDSIEVKKSFATSFHQNGKKLSARQLLNITKDNPEAYNEMKIAKSSYDAASVFGFAGGVLIGWPIGASLTGRELKWVLAGIGAGLALISLPLNSAYTKHATNAATLHNAGLRQTGRRKADMKLALAAGGVKIKMTF